MSTSPVDLSAGKAAAPADPHKVHDFCLKVVGDLAAAMSGPLLYLGDREGLFKTIASQGPMTVAELAKATGLQERYLREWSAAMVAAEYLSYDPASGKLWLLPERAMVLANETSPAFVGGMSQMIPDHYQLLPKLRECMHQGGGVPYSDFSQDTFEGTERLFGPGYANFMTQAWIPAMPEVHRKLQTGARVADVGCGRGRALLELARAFPRSSFVGFDSYPPAVQYANQQAQAAGLGERLRFEVRASDALPQTHEFDLIMTCDSLHDMHSPEGTARAVAGALKADGTWFIIEPNMADRVEDNINPIGKLFYSVSMLQCMTCSLASGGAGYGAGMGAGNIAKVTAAAGLKNFSKLPVEHPFNQFFAVAFQPPGTGPASPGGG